MKRSSSFVLFLAFACVFAFPVTASALVIGVTQIAIPTGLIGHWTFDGTNMIRNVADSSGQGNNGNLSGFTSTTTVAGKVGQALALDGANDSVSIGNESNFDFERTDDFSACAWANRNTNTTFDTVVAKFGETAQRGYRYIFQPNSGGVNSNESVLVDIFSSGSLGIRVTTPANSIISKRWHHTCLVYDGSGLAAGVQFYIDGLPQALTTAANGDDLGSNTILNNEPLTIGLTTNAATHPFSGSIDDVRIYNRALTAAEVSTLYKATGGGGSAIAATPTGSLGISSGLVLHQTFDGKNLVRNATDSSGQGNNGFLTNFTSTTTVAGRVGQALKFDGSNDYLSIPSSSSVSLTSRMTMSAWARPTVTPANFTRIIERSAEGAGKERPYVMDVTNNHYRCYLTSATETFAVAEGTSAVKVNQWTHVLCTYDGNNLRIYVNGVLEATSSTFTSGMKDNSKAVRLGTAESAESQGVFVSFFTGFIDDVRIYNRALSAAEVSALYKATGGGGSAIAATPTGNATVSNSLVGHWTFDGKNMIRNVADSSGQGNTAVLLNSTATTSIPGKVGQALRFNNSTTKFASVSGTAGFSFGGGYTHCQWLQSPEVPAAATIGQTFSYGTAVGAQPIGFSWHHSSATFRQAAYFANSGDTFFAAKITSTLSANRWYHICGTWDTQNLRVYLNGVNEATTATTGAIDSASGNLEFPRSTGATLFDVSMDDVRIYNRALSDIEIKAIYNLGR